MATHVGHGFNLWLTQCIMAIVTTLACFTQLIFRCLCSYPLNFRHTRCTLFSHWWLFQLSPFPKVVSLRNLAYRPLLCSSLYLKRGSQRFVAKSKSVLNVSSFTLPSFPLPSFPLPSFPLPSFPLPSFPLPSFPLPSFPLLSFRLFIRIYDVITFAQAVSSI